MITPLQKRLQKMFAELSDSSERTALIADTVELRLELARMSDEQLRESFHAYHALGNKGNAALCVAEISDRAEWREHAQYVEA